MQDVFTPKRFFQPVPLYKQEKSEDFDFGLRAVCSLTLRSDTHCRDWLSCGMHTAEFFEKLTPRCLAHRGDWLGGVMHTVRLTRWCDGYPRDYWDFVFSWLRGVMHTEEIDCSMMHTTESDLAVWCTSWRLSPWYDTHHGDWLSGGMHTAEHFKH